MGFRNFERLEIRSLLTASVAGVDIGSTAWTEEFGATDGWVAAADLGGDSGAAPGPIFAQSGIDKLRIRFSEPVSVEADGTIELYSPEGTIQGDVGTDILMSADGRSAEWALPRRLDAEFVGIRSDAIFSDASDGEVLPGLLERLDVLPGDATRDGNVEFDDFLELSSTFGDTGSLLSADFNGNGRGDFPDFLLLSNNFGLELEPGVSRARPFHLDLSSDVELVNDIGFTRNGAERDGADVYAFTLTEDTNITINIDDVQQQTDFGLYFGDNDNDGGFDNGGSNSEILEALDRVTGSGSMTETLSGHPDGLTYYLRVTPRSASTSTIYRLGFSADPVLELDVRDPGAVRERASNVDLAASPTITGVVTGGMDWDTYAFTLTEDTTVTINIDDVQEGTNFGLYVRDIDNDGGFDNGGSNSEILEGLENVTGSRTLTETLAGHPDGLTYYLHVTPRFLSTNSLYKVGFSSEPVQALDLQDPEASREQATIVDLSTEPEITGVVTAGMDSDTYAFTLTEDTTVTINIDDVQEGTNFGLYVSDFDGDGGFDNGGTNSEILEGLENVTDSRDMTETLAGHPDGLTYYLRVTPRFLSTSSLYTVGFSSEPVQALDLRDPGFTRNQAAEIDLQNVNNITGVITARVDFDTYKFTLTEETRVTIDIGDVGEATNFGIYGPDRDGDDNYDNGGTNNELFEGLDNVTGDRQLSALLPADPSGTTYYLVILPRFASTSSEYSLDFSAAPVLAAAEVDQAFSELGV